MGLLAHLFGLHPWDIERLSVDEFQQFIGEAKAWQKAQEVDD